MSDSFMNVRQFSVCMMASRAGDRTAGDLRQRVSCANVSQPGQTNRKLAASVLLRLGSFKFGVDQNQLETKKATTLRNLQT